MNANVYVTMFSVKFVLRLLIVCLVLVAPVYAQTTEYEFSPESKVTVDGTSNNTPEWTVYATELSGSITVNQEDPSVVQTMTLVVPSKMIKSRKSPIMDRAMHGTLKANDFPMVTYEFTDATDMVRPTDSTFSLNATGNLTIGAETRSISFPVSGTIKPNGAVHFKGSYALLMSDYGFKATVLDVRITPYGR